MKFFSTILALSALGGIAVATPFGPPNRPPPPPPPPRPTPEPKTTKAATPTPGHSTTTAGWPTTSAPHAYTTTSAPPTTATTTTTTYSHSHSTTSTGTSTASAPYGTVTCLTDDTASYLVNGFASLLTSYSNATAEAILASDFSDTADSINWLAGYPLGGATFPSKQAFELGQGSQPAIGFQLYSIDAVACKVIAFRWAAILGSGSPVKGVNIIYASNLNGTAEGWQIETNYSEFNSGLWLEEIGGSCSPPGQ